jgi:anaerobic C4-dicarboxylate transporter
VRCIYGIEPLIISDTKATLSEYEIYQKKLSEGIKQSKQDESNPKEKKKEKKKEGD